MAHQADLYAKFRLNAAGVIAAAVGVTAAAVTFRDCLGGNLSLGRACKLYDHQPHIEISTDTLVR